MYIAELPCHRHCSETPLCIVGYSLEQSLQSCKLTESVNKGSKSQCEVHKHGLISQCHSLEPLGKVFLCISTIIYFCYTALKQQILNMAFMNCQCQEMTFESLEMREVRIPVSYSTFYPLEAQRPHRLEVMTINTSDLAGSIDQSTKAQCSCSKCEYLIRYTKLWVVTKIQ